MRTMIQKFDIKEVRMGALLALLACPLFVLAD
jgi:hypothetical protein